MEEKIIDRDYIRFKQSDKCYLNINLDYWKLLYKSQQEDIRKIISSFLVSLGQNLQYLNKKNQSDFRIINDKKYCYIYLIRVLNYVYIGQHKTNVLNDSYLGSGKALDMIKNILPSCLFSKQIIDFFDSTQLDQKEQYFINVFYFNYKDKCLNLNYNPNIVYKNISNLKQKISRLKTKYTEKQIISILTSNYNKNFIPLSDLDIKKLCDNYENKKI